LDHAIALDVEYAEPHAELGNYYFWMGVWGTRPANEVMPLARAEAMKALNLFSSEPLARTTLAMVAVGYEYDWKEAEEQFQRAIATEPIPPEVRVRCARYNLAMTGRFEEAVRETENALEQDPLNALFRCYLSYAQGNLGRYDRAIAEARKAVEIDERFWMANHAMAYGYALRDMFVEALEWAENAYRLAPWFSYLGGFLAGVCSRAGDRKRAEQILSNLPTTGMPHIGMASYHLLRSEIDAAFDCYEEAVKQREFFAVLMASHGFTKPLRAHPRWPKLARMMNLPETV
jgi:tetratricopeptide (TPR) repeat protein